MGPHGTGWSGRVIRQLVKDTFEMARAATGAADARAIIETQRLDSYAVLAITRLREAARALRVPGANRLLRLVQMTVYGIEIGKDVELGDGVYFVHTLGTVIGGDSKIGRRVRFMGNNTVGTAKDNGYPVIEDDVVIGSGARILGPVRVGAGARIGANAVVLEDVPAGSVVVGIPARAISASAAAPQDPDAAPSSRAAAS